MYYASFGILAVIHHLIINYDILKNGRKQPKQGPHYRYSQFLNSILVFYRADHQMYEDKRMLKTQYGE